MSLNRCDSERVVSMYDDGLSLVDISRATGFPISTIRDRVKAAGSLRSQSEAIKLAASKGKMARRQRGRPVSEETRARMSKARREWADKNAVGLSLKPSGYLEITRGEHKGRSEHVRIVEARLGRRLLPDECVHHIDRDRTNNSPDNLALVTRAGHTRLHRFEDQLEGIERKRANGRFS